MVDGYLFNYQSVTASTYTATVGDSFIKCDCTSNAIAVTLPDADQTKGKRYTIKKIDATANAVTVSATQTIDDAASQIISTQYDSIDIMSDGVEYWIV